VLKNVAAALHADCHAIHGNTAMTAMHPTACAVFYLFGQRVHLSVKLRCIHIPFNSKAKRRQPIIMRVAAMLVRDQNLFTD
jgi:hypothetical protein